MDWPPIFQAHNQQDWQKILETNKDFGVGCVGLLSQNKNKDKKIKKPSRSHASCKHEKRCNDIVHIIPNKN